MKLLVLLGSFSIAMMGDAADPVVRTGTRGPISFAGSSPISTAQHLKLRLHAAEQPGPFDLSQERFEILVPAAYRDAEPHGLFIWISPGDKPGLPAGWDKVLAEEKLIFIGALRSGNSRAVFDRMRLAVDANFHLRKLFKVDPKRVYVSGHSGGARVASMLGVAYADVFSGAACFMGVNYFRDLKADDGTLFAIRYLPHEEIAQMALTGGRFALITGEKDFNRSNTQTVYEKGFVEDGFKGVKLIDIPGQGHGMPGPEWLEKAIRFLDQRE